MRLKVLLPNEVLIDQDVLKVVAQAENGSFCLLPRHVDFLAALVQGILSFFTLEGNERFLAVDRGILVKCGAEVLVSTRQAVAGIDLGTLEQTVEKTFRAEEESESAARLAFSKLEVGFIRRIAELETHD